MERRLRNNGEAMRNKAQNAGRPSERCERLERLVGRLRSISKCAHSHDPSISLAVATPPQCLIARIAAVACASVPAAQTPPDKNSLARYFASSEENLVSMTAISFNKFLARTCSSGISFHSFTSTKLNSFLGTNVRSLLLPFLRPTPSLRATPKAASQ